MDLGGGRGNGRDFAMEDFVDFQPGERPDRPSNPDFPAGNDAGTPEPPAGQDGQSPGGTPEGLEPPALPGGPAAAPPERPRQ